MTETHDKMPIIQHLKELRTRLLWCIGISSGLFIAMMPWANEIYLKLTTPLLSHINLQRPAAQLIVTDLTDAFLTPMKAVLAVSFLCSIPFYAHQAWKFIAPGLLKQEKYLAAPLIFLASILFYVGAAFGFWVVLPLITLFFQQTAPDGIQLLPDIGLYFKLTIQTIITFGFAFEVPVALIILTRFGLYEPNNAKAHRPYVIIGCFTVGMILTPPDVLSQFLLAIPLWLLYEMGIIAAKIVKRKTIPTPPTHQADTSTTTQDHL